LAIKNVVIKKLTIEKMVIEKCHDQKVNWKCGDQNLWKPKIWQLKLVAIKNLTTKSSGNENFGDQIPVEIEIMVIEFLWWHKDISVITWFTMTKMTLVLVTYKLAMGSPKWLLT
jgi:hypothetical protein